LNTPHAGLTQEEVSVFAAHTPDSGPTVYHRFSDGSWYGYEDQMAIFHETFTSLRRTRKGAWISVYGVERFVLDGEGKRYAYVAEDAAWQSYQIRKRRQLQRLAQQHDRIARVVAAIDGKGLEAARAITGDITLGKRLVAFE